MSERVRKEYLKRVSDLLERTGHPRRMEVLEDLEAHLGELAARSGDPNSIEELIETMGPPEEYAESLAPASGYRHKPWYRQRRTRVFAVLLLVATAAYVLVVPDRHTLAARVREATGRNFVAASPWFDLEKAETLTPGMAAGEIRETLGYPWYRAQYVGHEQEIHWFYTALPSLEAPFYTDCHVVTDAKDWTYLRTETYVCAVPIEQRGVARRPTSRHVGTVTLKRIDGKSFTLTPSDPALYVIIRSRYQGGDLKEHLENQEKSLIESWKGVSSGRMRFLHIFQKDTDRSELEEAMRRAGPDVPAFLEYPHSLVEGWEDYAQIRLYKDGTLYDYPPIIGSSDEIEQSYQDDRIWLVRRLQSEEV